MIFIFRLVKIIFLDDETWEFFYLELFYELLIKICDEAELY